jgi:hypothetical protein
MDHGAKAAENSTKSCPLLDAWWKNSPTVGVAQRKNCHAPPGSLKRYGEIGWRFLKVPLLVEDQLHWGHGGWLAIPPENYPYAARRFARRYLALAWAESLDGVLNREKAFELLGAPAAVSVPKLVG